MLYHLDNPITKIIEVEHLSFPAGIFSVAPRSYSSLSFRIRGTATIESGSQKIFANTGDILYLPQNMKYQAEYTDTEMLVIHFQTLTSHKEMEVYSYENGEELYKHFLQAHTLFKDKSISSAPFVLAALYTILGTLLEKDTKANLPAHFNRAVSFLNAHFKEEINMDAVCRESEICGTVLRALFKKYYQKTPVEYVTTLRLEHARNLISGGMSVENAAYESGFNDPKYFARVVKKHFGCTPRELKLYGK